MHADEVDTDPCLVQRLVAGQSLGTDSANYRLGDDKLVRLPRQPHKVEGLERELVWLPVLGPALPLPVPRPLRRGEPAEGFPFPWGVFTWVDGENVATERLAEETAVDLAELIGTLRSLDATGAPPGLRRGAFRDHDEWVRSGVAKFHGGHDGEGLLAAWEEMLEAPPWEGPPTWCHCDLDLRNVVFRHGRPSGVLDWGWAGAGDPASDAAVAWKMLPAAAREAFWEALDTDEAEIERARGWTLLQCAGALWYYTPENNPALFFEAERWLSELLG